MVFCYTASVFDYQTKRREVQRIGFIREFSRVSLDWQSRTQSKLALYEFASELVRRSSYSPSFPGGFAAAVPWLVM